MTSEDTTITEAALEAVGNLLAASRHHGIGVTFEPDGQGWRIGYIQGMGGGGLIPPTLALVADMWPPAKRGLPPGVVGAVTVALIVAPDRSRGS